MENGDGHYNVSTETFYSTKSNDESGLMGSVMSVGSSYKLEMTEKSPAYHRKTMNQKCNTAIEETDVIL